MSETVERITVTGEGVTVSLLVWRRFKAQVPGIVERVFALNTGLAASGPFIPVGTVVKVPIPAPRKERDVTTVRLWS